MSDPAPYGYKADGTPIDPVSEQFVGKGSPEVESGEPSPDLTEEQIEFNKKRDAIAELLKDDQIFRQTIAELYMFMSNMDAAIRSIGAMGGPKAMMKMLLGKGGNTDE